jgi:hypothetical protein
MGYHQIPGTEEHYCLISYDANGQERREAGGDFSQQVIDQLASEDITNVFFFCHGWKGDLPAAIDQYDRWMGALMQSADLAKAKSMWPEFKPLLIGLHWPSLPWGEEHAGADGSFAAASGDGSAQLLASSLEAFGDSPEVRAQLETIFSQARIDLSPDTLPRPVYDAYTKLNDALGLRSEGAGAAPDADREGFDPEEAYQASLDDGANFASLTLSGLLAPLGQLSYWTMKKRARTVGEGGMHAFLKDLQRASTDRHVSIHLMGHSFGTIVISGMLGGPGAAGPLLRAIDSVALVQGAVSLWSYAAAIPFGVGGPGYFHPIIEDRKFAGPLVTTNSRFDTAVGRLYPLASRLHGSASFAPGLPEFGGMGTYGLQGLDEAIKQDIKMLPADSDYSFKRGNIYNLESSEYVCQGDGASGAHSDICGPEVAHAIWQAAFASAS